MENEQQIEGWIDDVVGFICHQTPDARDHYEDLKQEGWVSALSAQQSYREGQGSTLKSWIITQLKRDLYRYIERERDALSGRVDYDWREVSWDDMVEANQLHELVDEEAPQRLEDTYDIYLLAHILSERELTVIECYYFQDLSEQEIADRQGVSRSMIQKIHRRALEKMRAEGIRK